MDTHGKRILLTPAEVAQSLGLGKSKVYQLVQDGVLPCARIGSAVRIPASALDAWVAELTTTDGRGGHADHEHAATESK